MEISDWQAKYLDLLRRHEDLLLEYGRLLRQVPPQPIVSPQPAPFGPIIGGSTTTTPRPPAPRTWCGDPPSGTDWGRTWLIAPPDTTASLSQCSAMDGDMAGWE